MLPTRKSACRVTLLMLSLSFTYCFRRELIFRLKEPAPLPKAIELVEGGTLKFTFTAIDTSSGESVSPKQAHLLFEDMKGEEDVTLPVTVKDNGKAGFTIVCHD
jgi:hypothetical protein